MKSAALAALRLIIFTAVCFLIGGRAFSQQPGEVITYNLGTAFCGITGGTVNGVPVLNCNGIQFQLPGDPVGSSGATWVDAQAKYQASTNTWVPAGFEIFTGPNDLAGSTAQITGSTLTTPAGFAPLKGFPTSPYVCNNDCNVFAVSGAGTRADGRKFTWALTMTMLHYVSGGSGRAGGGAGDHAAEISGLFQVTYL